MKKWIKIGLIIALFVGVSIGVYFILKALGVTSIDKLQELIANCGAWSWVVFAVLFITSSTLLCFIPGTSATFIGLSVVLFGAIKGFIICSIAVFITSSLLFLIGNTLGEKAAIKLVGKESLEKAQNLLDMKSKMFLPLMFLFPIFPDDALCLAAGMTKMRYRYFALITAIFRSVGIATICFLGSGLINWAALSIIDWFMLVSVCAFWLILIFKYQDKLEKFIIRKGKKDNPPSTNNKKAKTGRSTAIANIEKKIEKYKETIRLKKYCNEEQLHNIEKKITAAEAQVNKLKKVENPIVKSEIITQGATDRQKIVCAEIEKIMVNQFPKINYSIKLSSSTESVYLSFINENGIEKTIRFSDHKSNKGIKQYPSRVVSSNKDMVRIIKASLKALSNKTVIVLLDRLEKEKQYDN